MIEGKVNFQHMLYELDHKNELDDKKLVEADRKLFISKIADPVLLHKLCIKKDNLLVKETSDFGPMEVDAESQKKSLTEGKSDIQFQNIEDHCIDAIALDSSSRDHEKDATLVETANEGTLKILDNKHTATFIQENMDLDRAQKIESMLMVADKLVDGQRESLLSSQNKAHFADDPSNDSSFPMRIVPSDNVCLGPLHGPGSVSFRSTSTTSGRSFAFPVLSGEWIGSPVKMASSSRGHMKRHPWWKRCFGSCNYSKTLSTNNDV